MLSLSVLKTNRILLKSLNNTKKCVIIIKTLLGEIMAKKISYNKLVRDKIPEIIRSSGKICETEILSDEAYLKMLDEKLCEELAEYQKDQNIEELADLLEVLYATARARGYSIEELHHVRDEKQKSRGGFDKKILLKSVQEEKL